MIDILRTSEISVSGEPFILPTEIDNFCLIQRQSFSDYRGRLRENFRISDLEEFLGYEIKIVQNQTSESIPNVLRGIHAENQVKIITPVGRILAVVVDLRPNSKTFKKYVVVDVDNRKGSLKRITLCLGKGCGNSFYVPSDGEEVDYNYCVTGIYDPANRDKGVRFDDPTLAIPWPTDSPIVSDRDKAMPSLEEFLEKYGDSIGM